MNDSKTSQRRRKQPHRAILDATLELLCRSGYSKLTIDAIAKQAGVSRQTIYRWWPNKGAVVLEAYSECVAQQVQPQDTQDLAKDLTAFLVSLFHLWEKYNDAARAMIAEAQSDLEFREQYVSFNLQRRDTLRVILQRGIDRNELAASTNLDSLIDSLYGATWYRLLLGHAPLDQDFAQFLVNQVLSTHTPSKK